MAAASLLPWILAFAAGLGLGFVLAWWLRARPLELALVEARARGEEQARQVDAAETARREAEEELRRLRDEVRRLDAEKREVAGKLEAERSAHKARVDQLLQLALELEEKFAALADQVLGRNSARFLELVSERFEKHRGEAVQDLEARRRAIEELLRPVRESLSRFEQRVNELERAREGAYRALSEQVRQLAESQEKLRFETGRLAQALRRPQVRGRWGEFQLRNVVELAGMSEHVDYVTQQTTDGRLRPDAIVRLPGGKTVVVDVKTPYDAFEQAVAAEDEAERERQLERHARQVRAHVQQLARKEYWQGVADAPDFVVLFMSADSFYIAAIQKDPGLFEYAAERRVLIATPFTFIALLKAIAYGWQQEKIAEGAARIAATGRELHQRLLTFLGHVERLGRALGSAVDHYNRAVGSLESRVLPQARRFEELGAAPQGKAIAPLAQVEVRPRALEAPELPAPAPDGDATTSPR